MSLLKKVTVISFCVLFLAGAAQASWLDALVAYYPLDGNANDYTGNHPGTPTGAPGYVTGKFGQAVDLYYSSGQYITLGGNPYEFAPTYNLDGTWNGADGTCNMTISCWFTVRGFDTAWQTLYAKGENATWRMARYASTTNPYQMSWGASELPFAAPPVDENTFHHLVYIWKDVLGGGAGVDHRIVYLDGVKVADSTVQNLANDNAAANKSPQIGANPEASGRSWNGKIDDWAFWRRALSEEEVLQIYNNGAGASIGSLIPEPSTFVLLAAGLLGLLCYAWRKRK